MALRYCDRLAIFKKGKLLKIDKPIKALSRKFIKEAFSVESLNFETPVGHQICATKACEK